MPDYGTVAHVLGWSAAGVVAASLVIIRLFWHRREKFLHILPLAISHAGLLSFIAFRMVVTRESLRRGEAVSPTGAWGLLFLLFCVGMTYVGLVGLVVKPRD